MDSILTSIKGLLNITEECKDFDAELIIFINSALAIVAQLGAGPKDGFAITGDSETWNDFLGKDQRLNLVKSYVHHKVKLMFDPPASGTHTEVLNRTIGELEFRIVTQTEVKENE